MESERDVMIGVRFENQGLRGGKEWVLDKKRNLELALNC